MVSATILSREKLRVERSARYGSRFKTPDLSVCPKSRLDGIDDAGRKLQQTLCPGFAIFSRNKFVRFSLSWETTFQWQPSDKAASL